MTTTSLAVRVAAALAGGALAAGTLVPATAARDAEARAGSAGIGDPYWPQDGNGGIDVASYTVRVSYAFAARRLRGRTTVRLTATESLRRFNLDLLLPARSVRVDGQRARFRHRGHELVVVPRQPLAAGSRHRVEVRYAGRPSKLRYAGGRSWLASRREVVTMNEPHMAPWWFPSNDHPGDKARFDIRVRVPRGKQVVANGKLRGRTKHGATTTWRWAAKEPMATYLAFFAAGRFHIERGRRDGVPWVTAVSRSLPVYLERGARRLMRRTPEVVSWLSQDLGPYPFSVAGGLTTSLDPGFALENQTRPTYPAIGGSATWIVVHELAHQWFGDSVAVARWRDIWLNEGPATFMEWRWTETHGGPTAASQLASSYSSHPARSGFWKLSIADPGAKRVFDFAVYDRGAMTLQALRNRIGDDAFWRLLRTWLGQKAGGNGTSEEFEAMAAEISGEDLAGFFQHWLRDERRPDRTAENGLVQD